jgi:hypothetical protein
MIGGPTAEHAALVVDHNVLDGYRGLLRRRQADPQKQNRE